MLRSVLTYLLLLSVALQPFSREMTFMSFEMNRKYIIKNLCENRTLMVWFRRTNYNNCWPERALVYPPPSNDGSVRVFLTLIHALIFIGFISFFFIIG